jgi:aryl-alcohol dehydrogenase-like predicted oxidoreductase
VAWVLANPVVTSVLIGATRPEQLADTIAASDVELPAELVTRLDTLTAPFRAGDALE